MLTPAPDAKADTASNANANADMADILAEVIRDIAEGIDNELNYRKAVAAAGAGGPYEASLLVVCERKLQEAATRALVTVINHPRLRPGGALMPLPSA